MPVAARGRQLGKSLKTWRDALDRELRKPLDPTIPDSPKRLEAVAKVCVEKALEGDMSAIGEIGNRMDGRPAMAPEDAANLDGAAAILAQAWSLYRPADAP